MKLLGLNDSGFVKHPKKIHKAQFLAEMNQVVTGSCLVALIEPCYRKPGNWRRLPEHLTTVTGQSLAPKRSGPKACQLAK